MACGGLENSGRPVGFQKRDDIADQFVFGEDLRFVQTEEFLNPRQRLEMRPKSAFIWTSEM